MSHHAQTGNVVPRGPPPTALTQGRRLHESSARHGDALARSKPPDYIMADITMDAGSTLPKSGIPIAAGLENVYISIAGLIGAGKSTLATALGEHLGLPVYYEPVTDLSLIHI